MSRFTASRVIGGVTLAWLACFAYLGVSRQTPDVPGLSGGDAGAGHFVASLVLAVLLYLWLDSAFPEASRLRVAAIAFGSASAVGLIIELIQLTLPDREAQLSDAMLDLTGSALGVGALAMVGRPALRGPRVPAIVGTLGVMLVASTVGAIVWLPGTDEFCPGSVSDEQLPEGGPPTLQTAGTDRVDAGLVGLFDFTEDDITGGSARLDLVDRGAVEHLDPLGVRIAEEDALVSTSGDAPQIVDAIDDQFTIEAWVRPERLTQSGPARIVSHSSGVALDDVNFHLGQERHCLSFRVAGGSGTEWLLFDDVFDRPQPVWHLVATYDRGDVEVFVDGEPRFEESLSDGDLSGWSRDYPLLVANEATRDRPFLGDVYRVAVYDRALSAREVAQNYEAGL